MDDNGNADAPVSPGTATGAASDSVTERLGVELWRFQHALRATLDSALQGSGLSFSEYCVMELVRAHPGITAASLAERIFITRQALGRTVARLNTAGLLAASPGPGPSRPLRVTPRGDALLADVQTAVLAAHDRLFAPLEAQERLALIDMVGRCSKGTTLTRLNL
ncbi:MarR family winged helix-turn-helix transcriptional regulator [Streptomyces sp. NPDC058373]|uniref:MarR family winged helix-turn-helix transcriptional regulator n=1 Tax=Streptomyces sp. NPDC058373 TaxID=3346465 RepID=UPI00365C7AE7